MNRRKSLSRLLVLLQLAIATVLQSLAGDSTFRGQVVNQATSVPVENAHVTLDRAPADNSPEYQADTDPFGFFSITNVAEGNYELAVSNPQYVAYKTNFTAVAGTSTNKVIKLVPIDGKVFFDLFFQVNCLATDAALPGATINVAYWKPSSDLNGAPTQVYSMNTVSGGIALFKGMEDGFYQFTISRPGWETLIYQPPANPDFVVVGDKVRLVRTYSATAFLRPVRTDLKVTVTGFDPVLNQANVPLKGILLRLTGVSLDDPTVEVVPPIAVLTLQDGSFTFKDLPPIQWKVLALQYGYAPVETLVTPDAVAQLGPLTIPLVLEPTKLQATITSVYRAPALLLGAEVKLEGIRNSNTEGIDRTVNATNVNVLFENLLPGRYWLRVKHQTNITGLPTTSPGHNGPITSDSFEIKFFPKESSAELESGKTERITIDLDPVPARIEGRLFASDELGGNIKQFDSAEGNRIFHKIAQNGITFLEYKLVVMNFNRKSYKIDSDDSGHFVILIPPGLYGVQIPSMTDYTGANIEYADITNGDAPTAGPWPYPDTWPFNYNLDAVHDGGGLRFDSNHQYHLDLFLNRHYINLVGQVYRDREPFSSLIMSMTPRAPDQFSFPTVQEVSYNYLHDIGAKIVATGPKIIEAELFNAAPGAGVPTSPFLLRNVVDGTYTISLQSTEYDSPPITLKISHWDPPGVLPSTDPGSVGYFFPGISHSNYGPFHRFQNFDLSATWVTRGTINIEQMVWQVVLVTPPDQYDYRYVSFGLQPAQYFKMGSLPGRFFRFNDQRGGIPNSPYTIWRDYSYGWFTGDGNGTAQFTAYQDGPQNNLTSNNFPANISFCSVDLHAYSSAGGDRVIEIPGINVKFPNSTQPAGGLISQFSDNPLPTGATDSAGKWIYASNDVAVVDIPARLVRVNVYMRRGMLVTGKISGPITNIANAPVVLRNRFGTQIAHGIADANGVYRFPSVDVQSVYVDVDARGFIPARKRFDPPSPTNPDITNGDVTLDPVPAPTVDAFTMNRFGLFLPGVLKSGDSSAFDPNNARDQLTLTWKATARGNDLNYTLDGFDQADNTQSPPEQFLAVDRVSEVWVIDRRSFTNTFVNDPNQSSYNPVDPPAPLDYASAMKWIEPINLGAKDGNPYYVIHQIVHRGQIAAGNDFQGTFNLWEMPSGVFNPRLLVITEHGGVAVADYQLPVGRVSLQGMNMPPWVAGFSQAISATATAIGTIGDFKFDLHSPSGEGWLKIGTLAPKAQANISLDPESANATDDANLLYKYALGVDMPIGDNAPESSPLNFSPSFLGVKITGLLLEYSIIGKEKKTSLALGGSAGIAPPLEERSKDYKPTAIGDQSGKLTAEGEITGTAKIAEAQYLDADPLGNNILSGYSFKLQGSGAVDLRFKYDISEQTTDKLVAKIPPPLLGGALLVLAKTGALKTYLLMETTIASKIGIEYITQQPRVSSGGTVSPADQGDRWDFLGKPTNALQTDFSILLRFALGGQLSALWKGAEASFLVQAGAPANSPNPEGVNFKYDPIGRNPLFQRITGSLSGVARFGVNLWTAQYNKQFQWDFYTFDVDRTAAKPTAQGLRAFAVNGDQSHMELTPWNITYTVINPATAPAFQFVGKQGTLVQDFYRAGAFDISSGSKPLLAFTGTDPTTGQTKLIISLAGATDWNSPLQIATAGGIISIAAVENPAGGWIVAWSEISADDVGNPYPSSQLKYSVSDASGANWSAPAQITSANEAIFNVNLAPAGNKILLTYVSTSEGPTGGNYTVSSAVYSGGQWSAPAPVLPTQTIQAAQLAGTSSGAAILAVSTGDNVLVGFEWNGSSWNAPQQISTAGPAPVSVSFDSANTPIVAWQDPDNGLTIATKPSGQANWSPITTALNTASPDFQVVPITPPGSNETSYLVAWTSAGSVNSIFYAILDAQGQITAGPTEATPGSTGVYSKLHARAIANGNVAVDTQYTTDTTSLLKEIVIGQSAPQIKTLQVLTTGTHFYRAPNLRLVNRIDSTFDIEYEGALEEATDLAGPWTPVP